MHITKAQRLAAAAHITDAHRVAINRPACPAEIFRLCAWYFAHVAELRGAERDRGEYRITGQCFAARLALQGHARAVRVVVSECCEIAMDQGCPEFVASAEDIWRESGLDENSTADAFCDVRPDLGGTH